MARVRRRIGNRSNCSLPAPRSGGLGLILLPLALLILAGLGVCLYLLLSERSPRPQPPTPADAPAVAAKKEIPPAREVAARSPQIADTSSQILQNKIAMGSRNLVELNGLTREMKGELSDTMLPRVRGRTRPTSRADRACLPSR